MKISYNWLKEYLDFELSPNEVAELLTDIGLEVEDVQEYKGPGGGLEGLVIGEVKKVEKHPDADKLRITFVYVAQNDLLQIVCGAANVAEGQKVVVALPGATLHPLKGESFTIKKAKIRGVESSGMICAEDEIGVGESHDGIMVLPIDAPVGKSYKDFLGIKNDFIFEIGLTPNRADAFSHFGVARDLRAAINIRFEKQLKLKLPEINEALFSKKGTGVSVEVENPALCPRYSGILINNVKVGESPNWLKEKLRAVGQRSINNIVDVTNFILQELGQPLHAFDAAEIKGGKVVVKTLPQETEFITLDENTRKLSSEDLMICDAEKGMCIAGVFGGMGTGVKEQTQNIFLESAHFNPVSIRKTANRHNLRTDAAMRFEKGTDPGITDYALKRAAQLILEVAGGEVGSEIMDVYPQRVQPQKINLEYPQLDKIIGFEIDAGTVKDILEQLQMQIISESENGLEISVPPFKNDVTREADVIEEILRIYGVNRIPLPEMISGSVSLETENDFREKFINNISDFLASCGFFEMVNNSISRDEYYNNVVSQSPLREGGSEVVNLLKTENAGLNIMRQSMIYSGLEAISYNLNRKNTELKLFEIGKTYHKTSAKEFKEKRHLSLFLSGTLRGESWAEKEKQVDFFYLKSVVQNILKRSSVKSYELRGTVLEDNENSEESIFEYSQQYSFNNKAVVNFGLLKKEITQKLDVKQEVFYTDFNLEELFQLSREQKVQFKEITKFPGVRRDLALLLKEDIPFSSVEKIAIEECKRLLKAVNLFDVYKDKKLGENFKSYAVSYFFEDGNKTLTDKEIDVLMTKLMSRYQKELQAEIR